MKNFFLERKLLCLGDKSKFIFAQMIVENLPQEFEKFSLQIEHGKNLLSMEDNGKFFNISSFKIPPGFKIFIPMNNIDLETNIAQFCRILIFEEFPLLKDSTRQLIEEMQNFSTYCPPFSVVIMNLPHRQGSTDLDNLSETVSDAEKNYKNQNIDVCIFNSCADMLNVIYKHNPILTKYKKILSLRLKKIQERMDEFEFLYDDDFLIDCKRENGCLTPTVINSIFDFNELKLNNTDSLWESYNKTALKKIFPTYGNIGGNLNLLSDLWKYVLLGEDEKNSLPFLEGWDLTRENQKFIDSLKKHFLDYMFEENFKYRVSPTDIRDIISYKKLVGSENGKCYGLQAEYTRKLRKFVEEEAKNFLKAWVNSCIEHFERMIA